MTLRRYQQTIVRAVSQALAARHRRMLLQLPTGAGKTWLAAELVRRAGARRVLYVVPSEEIFVQTSEKLTAVGVKHEVLRAGGSPDLLGTHVLLAMSQTLARRRSHRMFRSWSPDLIVVDEAHKLFDQHAALLLEWDCPVVAMTATPVRADGRDLRDLYPALLLGPQVPDLQALGYLVPCVNFAVDTPDLEHVRIQRGDYVASELEQAYSTEAMLRAAPTAWLATAKGRRTIAFTSGVTASQRLVASYRRLGVRAVHVDGTTPAAERADALEALRQHRIDVVCNCNLLVEGLDVVEVDCIQLVTSTWSLARYLQMVGRGLRPSPRTRKRDLYVLDHGGMVARFDSADARRDWEDDGSTVQTARRRCRKCGRVMPAYRTRCGTCHKLVAAPKPRRAALTDARAEKARSASTPVRPCPAWARRVQPVWDRAEVDRVRQQLPLSYSDSAARKALSEYDHAT